MSDLPLKQLQNQVAGWGVATFGRQPAHLIGARMNVEVAELLLAFDALDQAILPGDYERAVKALGEECADVAIMLLQVAAALHVDLGEQIARKMEINRKRVWTRTRNGKVQHSEEDAS